MSKEFGSDLDVNNDWLNEDGSTSSIDMHIATGFPPDAEYDAVKRDHDLLIRATLAQCNANKPSRIRL
jgi:hypothetical protein